MAAIIQRSVYIVCRPRRPVCLPNLRVHRGLSTRKSPPQGPFQYCQELVRKHDYENFLATLLLPPGARESTIAIRAFNVSVAQVQDQVSQGTIGQMRMKFWADALEGVYQNAPPAQPVVIQLGKAVSKHKLTKQWLQRLVTSREDHLLAKSFGTVAEVEDYAEKSTSSVLYLTLECLGVKNVHADHAASHIGRAQGLVTLLRALPYDSQKSRVYIPLDLLVQHKVSQNDLLRGSTEKKVKDLVFDLASTANAHIEKAKSLVPNVPKEAKVALLPVVGSSSYLDRLRKTDFNAYDGRLMQRDHLLPWFIWWRNFRGVI